MCIFVVYINITYNTFKKNLINNQIIYKIKTITVFN